MKKLIFLLISLPILLSAQLPCNLTGANVYIDNTSSTRTLIVTVNGIVATAYNTLWTDTNGILLGSGSSRPFYTQWEVRISDPITGCDTIIYQDCIADTNAMCPCIMIYMPVCGCDGVMYANSCLADCSDVPWTPAISNGMPGGFLPCPQPSSCEVEIDGDSILCTWGNPIVLQASPSSTSSSFTSYYWTNGQSNNNILTITTPGTYCVVATDSSGCIDSACFTVSMNEIEIYSVPNPPEICEGDSIVLEIDTSYSNIVWSNGETLDRIIVHPTTQTTYIVEAIDSNGCEARGEITVTVNNTSPLSIYSVPNPPNICLGDSVVLETSTGFVTYSWNNGMTGPRIVDFPTQDTWYMVEAIDSNGCIVKEDIWVYVDTCNTAIDELFKNQLKIYPNPTSGTVNIQIPKGTKFDLTLIDIEGKIILEKKQISSKKFVLNTKKIRKGTYLIELKNVEKRCVKKLVIK